MGPEPGHVVDPNNASDGDLLIAWALFRAGAKWQVPALSDEARTILRDLAAKAVIEVPVYGTVLLPAARGFSAKEQPAGPVVNLSYWVLPALKELRGVEGSFPAEALLASGERLLEKGRFGTSDLPADWLSLQYEDPQPAPSYAPTFGYEAVRIPLYMAWALDGPPRLLAGVNKRWREEGDPADGDARSRIPRRQNASVLQPCRCPCQARRDLRADELLPFDPSSP